MNSILLKDRLRGLIPWSALDLYYRLSCRNPEGRGLKRSFGNNPVHFSQSGSDLVAEHLRGASPCLVMRFGWGELQTVLAHLAGRGYSDELRNSIHYNAGFFPAEDRMLDRFSEESVEILKQADVLAVTCQRGDEELVRKFHPDIDLISWDCIGDDALFYEPSWLSVLEGRRVLAVHPFVRTFEQQWPKRHLLFPKGIRPPEFELLTFEAVQSAGGADRNLPYGNWFDALRSMCDAIDKIEFDTALIGAGAYGMFLGAHIRKTGRKAVHMGGSLQLLFGVMGARWETDRAAVGKRLFNRYWVRPPKEGIPPQADRIENACYW